MASGVFISYRREDTAADAGRLYGDLVGRFGPGRVFMDVDNIPLGADVRPAITAAISSSRVVLVLIGPAWDETRLANEQDWVRIEIEEALRLGVAIIPIRVRRLDMPAPDDVPDSIRRFCGLNAAEVDQSSWRRDIEPIMQAVSGFAEDGTSKRKEPNPPSGEGPAIARARVRARRDYARAVLWFVATTILGFFALTYVRSPVLYLVSAGLVMVGPLMLIRGLVRVPWAKYLNEDA